MSLQSPMWLVRVMLFSYKSTNFGGVKLDFFCYYLKVEIRGHATRKEVPQTKVEV